MIRRILHRLRWPLRVLGLVLLLPVVAVAAALVVLNTAPGKRLLASEVGSLTSGMVTLHDVHGGFPASPRIGRIEIRDAHGVWLTVENARLDWSPLALLSGDARIQRLSADTVTVARLPVASAPARHAAPNATPFQLPVRVDLAALHVARLKVEPPVAGTAIEASLDGSAHLSPLQQGQAHVTLHAAGSVADLPGLGALSVTASVDGPWSDATTRLDLAAGQVGATVRGSLDVPQLAGRLTVSAHAPAMSPAPGIAFASVALDGKISGPLAAPDASGTLRIDGLRAAGAAVQTLAATVAGNLGHVMLTATAQGTRIPGPRPDLLASDPIRLTAQAILADPARPVTFDLSHKLFHVAGTAQTGGTIMVKARVETPDLGALAALGGVDLQGQAALDVTAARPGAITQVSVDGTVGLTGGIAQAVALVGPQARIGVTGALRGSDLSVSRLSVAGQDVTLAATGSLVGQTLHATADVAVPDLHAVQPTVSGAATLRAQADGSLTDLAVRADLSGDVATQGVPKGHVEATIDARRLPGAPQGQVAAQGQLDGAPVALAADVTRAPDGSLALGIRRGDWKSAHAEGALVLARGATLPTGHLALRMTRLADLRRLTGQALTGSVSATIDLDPNRIVTAQVRAERAGLPGTALLRHAALDARIDDPLADMTVAATLTADGVQAGKISGDARASVTGPRTALRIVARAEAQGVAGGPASLAARAVLDLPDHTVSVAALSATARGETARLLAPGKVSFGSAVAVDRLRVGLRDAVLEVAGRVSPTLDLTASLRNVTADLLRIADPTLRAAGTLSADARLTGTPARPAGTVRVTATGLRMLSGPAAGLPAAAITAQARLSGRTAQVNARVTAGRNDLVLAGTAPIDPAAAINLRATGGLDLTVLDPILTASGRRVRGTVTLDATVTGTLAAPRASGTAQLADGEVQDFAQGVHIDHIDALVAAEGDHLTLAHLAARAGEGTIAAGGTVRLAAPMPVDLHLTITRARPLASDRLTVVLDSDLSVQGDIEGRLGVAGRIAIERADIQIPERLPASIAVLDVRVPGQKPPPPPAPGPDIGLDVTLHAPGRIFLRGRGIDAELRGDLHVAGTAAHPQPSGGFELVRGSISVAGTTLTFTTGKVTFDGSGKLDPVVDFVASSTSGNVTATLTVTGYASAPKIALSSTPELPQDEVLAHLLFGQSAASLGPFQLGQIALAIAQLTGGPGAGFDPLGSARKALGLDRLSVGGGSGGSAGGASVQAGRYVAPGVYVGASQGTSGGGTQAQVQIDLYKGLKVETDVGTGGGSATGSAGSTSGTSVGLTYQFEY